MAAYQRDTEVNLKKLPLAKSRTVWAAKEIIISDYNSLNKISLYRYIFINGEEKGFSYSRTATNKYQRDVGVRKSSINTEANGSEILYSKNDNEKVVKRKQLMNPGNGYIEFPCTNLVSVYI